MAGRLWGYYAEPYEVDVQLSVVKKLKESILPIGWVQHVHSISGTAASSPIFLLLTTDKKRSIGSWSSGYKMTEAVVSTHVGSFRRHLLPQDSSPPQAAV